MPKFIHAAAKSGLEKHFLKQKQKQKMDKKKRRLEDCPNQRYILCPWQKAKKRKKKNAYCIWTANDSSSSASCSSFLSFKIFPRLFMAWTYLGFNLEMERKAKQTVTTPLFSPNAQKSAKMEESLGEEPASWRARLHAYTCVPDCFPVVSDGCCLVALISQVFANVVVNLKAQLTLAISTQTSLSEPEIYWIF